MYHRFDHLQYCMELCWISTIFESHYLKRIQLINSVGRNKLSKRCSTSSLRWSSGSFFQVRQLRVELEAAKGEKVEVRASGCWELTSARRWWFGNGLELRLFFANGDMNKMVWCYIIRLVRWFLAWWHYLGGGFEYFLFSPLPGEMIQIG